MSNGIRNKAFSSATVPQTTTSQSASANTSKLFGFNSSGYMESCGLAFLGWICGIGPSCSAYLIARRLNETKPCLKECLIVRVFIQSLFRALSPILNVLYCFKIWISYFKYLLPLVIVWVIWISIVVAYRVMYMITFEAESLSEGLGYPMDADLWDERFTYPWFSTGIGRQECFCSERNLYHVFMHCCNCVGNFLDICDTTKNSSKLCSDLKVASLTSFLVRKNSYSRKLSSVVPYRLFLQLLFSGADSFSRPQCIIEIKYKVN